MAMFSKERKKMNDPTFSMAHIHNRAGITLDIIEKQGKYPIYLGDDMITIFLTLQEAISFARNYGITKNYSIEF